MEVEMLIDNKAIKMKAAVIIIANATTYGTYAVINPIGKLDDDMFEVIAVKKYPCMKYLKWFFGMQLAPATFYITKKIFRIIY